MNLFLLDKCWLHANLTGNTLATRDDKFFDGSHNKEIISFLNKMNYELYLRINT